MKKCSPRQLLTTLALALSLAAGQLAVASGDDSATELAQVGEQIRALANAEGTADARLESLADLLYEYVIISQPESATYLGEPRSQDRWSDQSMAAIRQGEADTREALATLQSIPRDQLSDADKVNYDLLLDTLEGQVEGQAFPGEFLVMNQMGGPQQNPANILSLMRVNTTDDLENVVARLEGLDTVIDQSIALMRQGMEKGITPPKITLRDVPQQIRNQMTDDVASAPVMTAFSRAPAGLDEVQVQVLRERAGKAYSEQVIPAYERLLTFVENEYLPAARDSIGLSALPDGENWYAFNVRQMTTTDMSPEQIHQLGLSEVARIRGEMEAIIEQVGFEGDFAAFLEFLRTDPQFYHETPEALLMEYRDISKRADPELTKLFGKLPRTPYGVVPVPSYAEKSQTTAYYQPGSLKAGRPGNFFANTYALETRPRWEMEALTLHEAVPGHHLQVAIQQELEDVPWYRQVPTYTAFIEGWGLYSESLGEEMGFYKDPYSKFGQLTYEMWRAIRLVVDTGMHAKGWSRQQAIDFFKENAGKQEHDIVVEVDRYIVWPGQALAYKIGELKIKELRAWSAAELGEAFDIRDFHDTVLENGAVPLDVLEANVRSWVAQVQAQ